MSKVVGKKVPPKQVVDDSESEDSGSEPAPPKAVASKKDKLQAKIQDKQAAVAGVKAPAKKAPAPQSESEEDDTPPVVAKKNVVAPAKKAVQAPPKKTKEPSEESESDSEPAVPQKAQPTKAGKAEPVKPIKKGSADLKKAPIAKGKPQPDSESESEEPQTAKKSTPVLQAKGKKPETAKVPEKKAPAKPATSSESESEEPKPAKKSTPVLQAKKKPEAPKATKAVAKPETSSESESEEAPKVVKGKATVQAKKPAPAKKSDSDESSEPEIVAKGKKTAASPKQAPKPSPKQAAKPSPKLGAVAKKPVKPAPKEESDEESEEPAPKKTQVKQPAKGKKVVEPEPESDEEEEEKPVAKTAGKRKGSTQKEEEKGEFEVYVGGLAWAMAEADIEALFAPCGEILEVRLLRKEDGKSKGIAFVKFSTESARTEAIKLNESEQFGRPIKVEKSTGKTENPNKGKFNNGNAGGNKGSFTNDKPIPDVIESCTIFVGNMAYGSTPDSIKAFFSDCGEIKDARIATDKESGRARGFGYVEFYDTDSVRKALGKRGGELDGRFINIDVAAERKKDGFGGNGGYGGNRGPRGNFRGNNNRGANVALDEDDKNAKKGNMGTFKGTIKKL